MGCPANMRPRELQLGNNLTGQSGDDSAHRRKVIQRSAFLKITSAPRRAFVDTLTHLCHLNPQLYGIRSPPQRVVIENTHLHPGSQLIARRDKSPEIPNIIALLIRTPSETLVWPHFHVQTGFIERELTRQFTMVDPKQIIFDPFCLLADRGGGGEGGYIDVRMSLRETCSVRQR